MKNVKRFVIFFELFLFTLVLSAISTFADDFSLSEKAPNHCYHSGVFDFNEETMTLDGAYTINTIEWLMDDVDFYGDKAIVYSNGTMLTEGYLQEGMSIEIYHGKINI